MQPSLEVQFILQTGIASLCPGLSLLEDAWLSYSNIKQKPIHPSLQASLLTGAQSLINCYYAAFKHNKLVSAPKILQDRWVLFTSGPTIRERNNCRCLKLAGPDGSRELI